MVVVQSVLFVNNENTVVRDITSVNSKFFHIALLQNRNIRMSGLRINAPGNSPNTDGIHIERSAGVVITDTRISTGDDCISIGQGNDNIDIARVHCGPGHGMSVGSLGRYVGEGDVTRVHVRDMNFEGTMNGVRIKTWENSPTKSVAAHMLFENLVMKDVQNPIIIDQKYCPYYNCEHKVLLIFAMPRTKRKPYRSYSLLQCDLCFVDAVRVGSVDQGHPVQEHQGFLDDACGGVAPVRRGVPGGGAAGCGPAVQGAGPHVGEV